MKAKIKEIFSSIQGEGPVIGYKQLFVRFCNCNLKCNYCDTDYSSEKNYQNYTAQELYNFLKSNYDLKSFHSISLTGGEPLLSVEFLKEFLPLIRNEIKIYLETNATLANNFLLIKDYIDIIAADIKLASSSGQDILNLHEEFFNQCSGKNIFAKIVFDENITEQEIINVINLASKYNIEIVLQPKMVGNNMKISSEFCEKIISKISEQYPKVRLIPQVHKFINVR